MEDCGLENKAALYHRMEQQLDGLIEACPLPLPALANCAALLWSSLDCINWAGFYLLRRDTLYLGPFQGKIACTVIPVGRGVCGTAALTREIQLVRDVHQFPGHIACDSASQSEIVLPLVRKGVLYGVMDLDSPQLARFDEEDAAGLGCLCRRLMENTVWEEGLLGA